MPIKSRARQDHPRNLRAAERFTYCLFGDTATVEADTFTVREYPADLDVVSQIDTVRKALPTWVIATVELVELAQNAERAAVHANPETAQRSRNLIVEVAEWQQKLSDWQSVDLSPRLKAELRILKATLDASMDEANGATAELQLFS